MPHAPSAPDPTTPAGGREADTPPVHHPRGEADAPPKVLDAELLAALELIASFAGKTLLGPADDPAADHAHQVGANKAFEECASIARAALAKAP